MNQTLISWWLDWSALPGRHIWARLSVDAEGGAVVLDCDGKHHFFPNENAARRWLAEDEYSVIECLIETGELSASVMPPSGATEALLVLSMTRVVS
jgi:hypothetical protein